MTISIVAREAADIASRVRAYVKPTGSGWFEVQAMGECAHGCNLYVRQRGELLCYQLMHNAVYGCGLAADPKTATVRVSVQPTKND